MNAPHFLSLYVLHYSIARLFIQVLNSYKFLKLYPAYYDNIFQIDLAIK